MKKTPGLIFFFLLLAFSSSMGEQNCFLVIAGRKATADGSVLMGHNEDNGIDKVFRMFRVERQVHRTGEYVELAGGGRLVQADTTWGYLMFEMPGLSYSHCLLNEHAVAVVSNNCPSREDNPGLTDGGIGPMLRLLVAQRARSAREGVKLVGSWIERFGYVASGRTLTICDPREGWQVAMVKGKHWLARRVPDAEVAVLANSYGIHEVDLSDSLNFLGSDDIVRYAQKLGWYDSALDGEFDFERAYARVDLLDSPFQVNRQWSGFRHFARDEVPLPVKGEALPFSVKPRMPVGPKDIFRALRDHYEKSPYEVGVACPHVSSAVSGIRAICAGSTNHGDVFQLRANVPVEVGALWWISFWRPCASPFLPLYFGVLDVPEELYFEVDPEIYNSPASAVQPGADKAIRVFRDLSLFADEDYKERLDKIHQTWSALERQNLSVQAVFEGQVLADWESDRQNMLEALSRYCHETIERAMKQARKLADE